MVNVDSPEGHDFIFRIQCVGKDSRSECKIQREANKKLCGSTTVYINLSKLF